MSLPADDDAQANETEIATPPAADGNSPPPPELTDNSSTSLRVLPSLPPPLRGGSLQRNITEDTLPASNASRHVHSEAGTVRKNNDNHTPTPPIEDLLLPPFPSVSTFTASGSTRKSRRSTKSSRSSTSTLSAWQDDGHHAPGSLSSLRDSLASHARSSDAPWKHWWHDESGGSFVPQATRLDVVDRLPHAMEEAEKQQQQQQQQQQGGEEQQPSTRASFHSVGEGGPLTSRPLLEGDEGDEGTAGAAKLVESMASPTVMPSKEATDHDNFQEVEVAPDLLTEEYARQRIHFLFPAESAEGLPADFPKLAKQSFCMGKHLGRGCSSDVEEIVKVHCRTDAASATPMEAACDFLATTCLTPYGEARYALKHVRPDVQQDPAKAWTSMVDLVVETRILSQLMHPHIIKLRAVAAGNPLRPGYFIVLDRLYDTLQTRLVQWGGGAKSSPKPLLKRLFRRKNSRGTSSQASWEERLTCAYNLASAVEYMHEKRLIHRDLKPENCGFDLRGDIKVFDFGMSRQIPSTTEVFLLSGMTGSFRYMAPEVANSLYYNQRCDVYSFSLLLWEMLMLQRPYDNFPNQEVFMRKVFQQNARPTIPKKWSRSLRALLAAGWTADQDHRLDMSILRSMLRAEVMHCKDGDETTLKGDSFRRRSTHVYVFKEEKRPVIHAPAGFEASGNA